MNEQIERLFAIADKLKAIADQRLPPEFKDPLDRLEEAAKKVGKSWGGSWLGYQAYVYFENFEPPPPGIRFSQEFGLEQLYTTHLTTREWLEWNPEVVEREIYILANNPELSSIRKLSKDTEKIFVDLKNEVLSIFSVISLENEDQFLIKLKNEIEEIVFNNKSVIIKYHCCPGVIFHKLIK